MSFTISVDPNFYTRYYYNLKIYKQLKVACSWDLPLSSRGLLLSFLLFTRIYLIGSFLLDLSKAVTTEPGVTLDFRSNSEQVLQESPFIIRTPYPH